MASDDAYARTFYLKTGHQDCSNTFSIDDVDFASGNTAEEIVDNSLEWMTLEDWAEQQEFGDDDITPESAYDAWRTGWRACAISIVREALPSHLTKAEIAFKKAFQTIAPGAIEVAQDIALENGLKLWQLGQKFANIERSHGGYDDDGQSYGMFDLVRGADATTVFWNLEQRTVAPGQWLATKWLYMRYEFQGHEWVEDLGALVDVDNDHAPEKPMAFEPARRLASEYAWSAVKVFSKALLDLGPRAISDKQLKLLRVNVENLMQAPGTPEELLANHSRARRRNGDEQPKIKDEGRAVDKYREFNSFDPKELVYVDGSPIPKRLRKLGVSEQITYDSMKVIPDNGVRPRKKQGYFHDHETPKPNTYEPDPNGDVETPDFIAECDALALIGDFINFKFTDADGNLVTGKASRPAPQIYCTPNGRALLVIQSKKTVLAIIYGGDLTVESRGIVG